MARKRNAESETLDESQSEETTELVAETTEVVTEVTEVAAEVTEAAGEVAEDKPAKDLSPAQVELKTGGSQEPELGKMSKEQIEASIKEKLSRRTDGSESDPFVPNTQLENEVKQIAQNKGFPLSRGTEIGARLLARSQRTGK